MPGLVYSIVDFELKVQVLGRYKVYNRVAEE